MAAEGPTTAGSIEAKLLLDDSDFMAKLAAADAAARKLGEVDPHVDIHVDDNGAAAKLAAVEVAAKSLGGTSASTAAKLGAVEAAQRKLSIATDATKLAYQRLDDIQSKGGASETKLMAAHLAAARAEESQTSASNRLAAAQLDLAAAENVEAAASGQASDSSGGYTSRLQMMALAIGALVPLFAPVVAAAVGLAGGLAGMGAAGVLAIFGIKQAMNDGTTAGKAYTQTLDTLKTEFDRLASTAAVALLADFNKAAQLVKQNMPALNGEIQTFASILGGASVSAVDGIVNAFEVMNPLFNTGADLIAQIAAGFDSWTKNGGLQQFTDYAMRELPQVITTIGLLSDDIVKLTQELGPAGEGMLTLLHDAALLLKGLQQLQDGVGGFAKSWEKAAGSSGVVLKSILDTVNDVINPVQSILTHLGQLGDAMSGAGDASAKAAPKVDSSTQAIGNLDDATGKAMDALDQFNAALQGLGQTNLDASQANIKYQQSLADTSAAIKANGATLDLSTQKGRDNMSALDDIASSAVSLVAAQQKAGSSTETLMGTMGTARLAFINAAMAAGDTREAASKLADQYGLIPSKVSTAFNTSGAQAAIDAAKKIAAAQAAIERTITIHVNTVALTAQGVAGPVTQASGKAKGGLITEYHAAGGVAGMFQPQGTDTVPTMLTPGEFVLKRSSVAYNPPFVKAYNENPGKALAQVQPAPQVTHIWKLYGIQDPAQLAQQMAARQNALTV